MFDAINFMDVPPESLLCWDGRGDDGRVNIGEWAGKGPSVGGCGMLWVGGSQVTGCWWVWGAVAAWLPRAQTKPPGRSGLGVEGSQCVTQQTPPQDPGSRGQGPQGIQTDDQRVQDQAGKAG
jgi:hypothetical protein